MGYVYSKENIKQFSGKTIGFNKDEQESIKHAVDFCRSLNDRKLNKQIDNFFLVDLENKTELTPEIAKAYLIIACAYGNYIEGLDAITPEQKEDYYNLYVATNRIIGSGILSKNALVDVIKGILPVAGFLASRFSAKAISNKAYTASWKLLDKFNGSTFATNSNIPNFVRIGTGILSFIAFPIIANYLGIGIDKLVSACKRNKYRLRLNEVDNKMLLEDNKEDIA